MARFGRDAAARWSGGVPASPSLARASGWFAGAGLWVAALACSFLFFLVALRLDAAVPELMAQAGRVLG